MLRSLALASLTLALPATASAQAPAPVPAQTAAPSAAVTKESAGTVSPAAAPGQKVAIPTEFTIQREVFAYDGGGRRDPYKSLMSTSDVRPLLSDLKLMVVAYDPSGGNSVAILRDNFTKQQYRARIGQQFGRMRVSAIKQKAVQFTVEEFGFNRVETLPLSSDTTKVRNP
jgi:hypothetical protein